MMNSRVLAKYEIMKNGDLVIFHHPNCPTDPKEVLVTECGGYPISDYYTYSYNQDTMTVLRFEEPTTIILGPDDIMQEGDIVVNYYYRQDVHKEMIVNGWAGEPVSNLTTWEYCPDGNITVVLRDTSFNKEK